MRQESVCGVGRVSESILHDLRNPLAAICGAAEMLVNGDLPPDHIKRLAGNICGASQRIHALLQELLSNSRGESRGPERCRLGEIALAAWESLRRRPRLARYWAVEIQPEIQVQVERSRMERAFANLIGNAIEAMPEAGEVRISGQFAAGSVVVHVDDSGPGVAPEIRSKLFQPFVTTGKRHGLGLGLAFTRQTVLDYGGDLWVDLLLVAERDSACGCPGCVCSSRTRSRLEPDLEIQAENRNATCRRCVSGRKRWRWN